MTRIEGKTYDEFVKTASPDEKSRAAATIFSATFQTLFKHGIFNADPSPGNFLFLPDGTVGMIDFGCVKSFDLKTVDLLKRHFLSVQQQDVAEIFQSSRRLRLIPELDDIDRDAFGARVIELHRPWLEDRSFRIGQASSRGAWEKLAVHNPDKFRMRIPSELLFWMRFYLGTLSVLEGLDAECNWYKILQPFLKKLANPSDAGNIDNLAAYLSHTAIDW